MNGSPSRGFARLALMTALITWGLIVFGAIVRVTDSGLGCGNHWPSCAGTFFPPLDNIIAWIEWTHRLLAALIGFLGIAMLVWAIRSFRQRNRRVLWMTVTAAVLFAVQSMLGAIVVWLELPPTFVAVHLGTAMLLFAALLIAWWWAREREAQPRKAGDSVTALVYTTAALVYIIILTGALVRGSGASLACTDWPLCNGELLPFQQGLAAVIHTLHRWAVLALGVTICLMLWQVLKNRSAVTTRRLAWWALIAYGSQATVGALFVLSRAAPFWGAAHVGTAAATWGVLVVLSIIEWGSGGQTQSN